MALAHIAVLTAALVVPISVPYAVAIAIRREESRRRRAAALCRPEDTRQLRRLDVALKCADPVARLTELPPPPIEQLAHDLRRLHRQRRGGPTVTSELWLAAVQRAYDERLCMACDCLGVRQNLRPLDGMDREIERVRVEGELEAAGLELR